MNEKENINYEVDGPDLAKPEDGQLALDTSDPDAPAESPSALPKSDPVFPEQFLPDYEFSTLMSRKKELQNNPTPQAKAEFKQAWQEFRDKLEYQRKGINKIIQQLYDEIQVNPNQTHDQLMAIVHGEETSLSLNKDQIFDFDYAIKNYVWTHQRVEKLAEDFPRSDELFKHLFRTEPIGVVNIMPYPMSLHFECHNLQDYTRIYYADCNLGDEIPAEYLGKASKSGGAAIRSLRLGNIITAENGYHFDSQVRVHEQQHQFNSLFSPVRSNFRPNYESYAEKSPKELFNLVVKQNLRAMISEAGIDLRVRDEFLAYIKDGRTSVEIPRILSHSSLYNYLEEDSYTGNLYVSVNQIESDYQNLKNTAKPDSGYSLNINNETAESALKTEYDNLLAKFGGAIQTLERKLYNPDEIVSLLYPEEIWHWQAVANGAKRLSAWNPIK